MPAKSVASDPQWDVLLQYMQEHPDLARGSVANEGPLAKQRTIQLWRELAARLNCVGTGATKSPEKWRDYWNNSKYAARKKASARRQQAFQTGGGPIPKKLAALTDRDEKILALIGRVAVYGEESVRIPFDDLPEMPTPSTSSAATSLPFPPQVPAASSQQSPEWPEPPAPEDLVEFEIEIETEETPASTSLPLPPPPSPPTAVQPPPADRRRRTGKDYLN